MLVNDEKLGVRTIRVGQELGKITVFVPRQVEEGDYECRLSISIGDQNKESRVVGIDGIQAVQLAFRRAEAILNALTKESCDEVSWLDMPGSGLASL
ncbi:MAG: hypothetical protein QNJ40_08365 [Xanthomonadales bacterium]|nr:hypothetical protein [Xanthomonadales bacterium]